MILSSVSGLLLIAGSILWGLYLLTVFFQMKKFGN